MYKPQLVFMCETKLMTIQMNNVGKKLNFNNYFTVSSNEKSGGFAILQNSSIRVNITSFSNYHIDVEVDTENEKHIRCTRVYEHAETSQKKYIGPY